jgi:beta-RFAP synthase
LLDDASMSADPAVVLPASRLAAGSGAVRVAAPGRLHLGFLDPSGSLGRPFGSVGVVIDGFETAVEIRSAARDEWLAETPAATAELERAAACVMQLRERTGRCQPLALRLGEVLPAHSGLGSGTQLALAVGRAFARWQGLELATPTLAQWLGRGRRSGVGIAGFDVGGLLLDGGPGPQGEPAALLSRIELPQPWRIVVVQDVQRRGLSGAAERAALATLPAFAQARAAEVCHEVLMRVLPGAAGADFAAFAAGVNHVQALLGEHFAPAQDGSAWSSAAVGRVLTWMREAAGQGVAIGQSSWGPTGFAFVPSLAEATALIERAQAAGVVGTGLRINCVAGRNRGAVVTQR